VNKREFETANRRLGDALKRVAPELDWYDDTARAFDGYQCVWNGVASPRSFRSSHIAKSFHTYSWSWDGSIDEAYLLEKIRTGRYQTYARGEQKNIAPQADALLRWTRVVALVPGRVEHDGLSRAFQHRHRLCRRLGERHQRDKAVHESGWLTPRCSNCMAREAPAMLPDSTTAG
jgi:hypothetical protein